MDLQHSKTAASILNERARKFHLKLKWNLTDEFGPPHDRTFCVQVSIVCRSQNKLEVFHGAGKSIKAARQIAASVAISGSSLLKDIVCDSCQLSSARQVDVSCLNDLVNCIPYPFGPVAELKKIAKIFQLPTKFISLSAYRTGRENHFVSANTEQIVLHRVALEFAGRQYLGEGVVRSTSEQYAASAALKALRRALLSLVENTEEKQPAEPARFVFRPDSAVWRLRVIGKLHGERPVFVIDTASSPILANGHSGRDIKQITCACSLKYWNTVHGVGHTLREARENAARLMLDRLSRGPVPPANDNPSTLSGQKTTGASLVIKSTKKSNKSQTQWQFACDRANLSYGQEVNPIARLYFVCVARGFPAPVFEPSKGCETTVHLSSGLNKLVPEFCYKVRVNTDSVRGPVAFNKRLAKRLAAEAALEHLNCHAPDPPKLHSALRSSWSHNSDNQSVTDMPLVKVSRSESVKGIDSPSSNEGPDSLNDKHVTFSCSRDVLILEDSALVPWKRPHRSARRTHHSEASNRDQSHSKSFTLKSAPACGDERRHSVVSLNDSTSLINIGHWADSKEAQSTYRPASLRRANSCSQIDYFECDVSMDPARSGSLHELMANPLRTKTTRGDALDLSINPSLHLLCQLAVFCLMEHASRSDKAEGSTLSKRPTSQLTSVCQRLQIPCQFTDHQLKSNHLEKETISDTTDQSITYSTTLTIGVPLRTSLNQKETSCASLSKVVVNACGRTKEIAHDNAVLLAFRQLAHLHAPDQSTPASARL